MALGADVGTTAEVGEEEKLLPALVSVLHEREIRRKTAIHNRFIKLPVIWWVYQQPAVALLMPG
jgi:hypothetical protein